MVIYLFIYLFINQTLLSATYTMTSGQLNIVYNCSNLNKSMDPLNIRYVLYEEYQGDVIWRAS